MRPSGTKERVVDEEKGSGQLTIDTSVSSSSPLLREEFLDLHFKEDERLCLNHLKTLCLEKHLLVSDQLIYRFAIFHGFNVKRAVKAIAKNYDHHGLKLLLGEELVSYLEHTKMLFPIPGLKSAIGSEVLYWHPSRYLPSERNNRLLIDCMSYVLNDMSQTIDQCRNGILMIVNMNGYQTKNFHRATQVKLASLTEGRVVPARVLQVLIVNPPKIFKRIWNTAKTAFSPFFSKKIQIIECSNLRNYLMDGSEAYLPDEVFALGKHTPELVEDYIESKTREESLRYCF